MADGGDYVVGDEFANEWNRIRAKVDGANGPDLHNTPTSLSHAGRSEPSRAGNPLQICKLQIVGPVSGATGRYTANTIYGGTNSSPGLSISTTDLGMVATSNTVECWNLSEVIENGFALVQNQPVLAILCGYNTTTKMPIYVTFQNGNPNGQYQYQVLQMVTQNQIGFEYPRTHPLE